LSCPLLFLRPCGTPGRSRNNSLGLSFQIRTKGTLRPKHLVHIGDYQVSVQHITAGPYGPPHLSSSPDGHRPRYSSLKLTPQQPRSTQLLTCKQSAKLWADSDFRVKELASEAGSEQDFPCLHFSLSPAIPLLRPLSHSLSLPTFTISC
jgi:hypothetical protein